MTQAELLTVEQVFQIQHTGLVVVPDFSIPKGGWKNASHIVRVIKPNGEHFEVNAHLGVWHFNIRDPSVSPDRVDRVIISFPDLKEDDVPVGSKILTDPTLVAALNSHL